jgi:hypothetical protein
VVYMVFEQVYEWFKRLRQPKSEAS